MSNKTFTADKIKTNEICGIDGGSVTICGIDNNNFPTISGGIISGENLLVSGDGNSLATFNSGVFNELVVNGVRYVPRNQIAYGFYFGGPPIDVPNRGPSVSGGGDNVPYSGLVSGTNHVFIEDSGSFGATGDHVVIGGLYDENENQEIHTVTGFTNYYPTNCCNSKVYTNRSIGQNRIYYHEESEAIGVGDKIRINEDETVYTVTSSYNVPGELKFVDLTPNLTSGYQAGECICITPDTLLLESNLSNNYTGGTKVAKKYASGDACFDTSHLYLEKGMYKNQNFDWYMTGYRQSFIDFSGVQVHITGQSTSGLLTLQYPDV